MALLGTAILAPALSASSLPLTRWESASGGNDHYYQVFFDANHIPWSDAYDHAQAQGGYLATIFSAEENEFIKALTLTVDGYLESWIGLTDVLKEGTFVWVTGESTIAFDNWAPNEPNNDPFFGGER